MAILSLFATHSDIHHVVCSTCECLRKSSTRTVITFDHPLTVAHVHVDSTSNRPPTSSVLPALPSEPLESLLHQHLVPISEDSPPLLSLTMLLLSEEVRHPSRWQPIIPIDQITHIETCLFYFPCMFHGLLIEFEKAPEDTLPPSRLPSSATRLFVLRSEVLSVERV